jgi:hypothetical protein
VARSVSAAALRAAREILKEYRLEVRSDNGAVGMNATEGHVAIVIDYATGVYKVAQLRPELNWWQQQLKARQAKAGQLAGFLQKLVEAFRELPQYGPQEQPVRIGVRVPLEFAAVLPNVALLTKGALEVVRFLRHYYTIRTLAGREFDDRTDSLHIAQLADGVLGMDHAQKALPLAERYLERMKKGQATEKEVRACFRDLGILLESLPGYFRARQEEMMHVS